MEQSYSDAEINRAKSLHSLLLFDFIVVHVFLFVLALSLLKTSPIPMILMPLLSIGLLVRVIFKARQARTSESSEFVLSHMLLAGKRAQLFLILFLITFSFTAIILLGGAQFGMSKVTSYALAGGIGQLPFMVSLLVLVVLEFDAEHQCKSGKIPAAATNLLAQSKKA